MFALIGSPAGNALTPPPIRLWCLLLAHQGFKIVGSDIILVRNSLKWYGIRPGHQNNLFDFCCR